jgi:hypothetical protein
VYVKLEQDTVSPEATVKPLVMLMSLPEAATAQWITTVPPDVCNVAVATGDALPVAFVSAVIALAVAVPLEDAPKAVALSDRVATAVPGEPTVPDKRNTNLPEAPIKAVTASVAALRAAVECVTAILFFLLVNYMTNHFDCFNFACIFTSYL